MTKLSTKGTAATTAAVPTKRIIDEVLYQTLKDMFNSRDKENYPIAEQILIDVDIEKSIYYLWKLLKGDGVFYKLNRRLKRVRDFLSNVHISNTWNASIYNFTLYVKKTKLLTPEIWNKVESDIQALVKRRCINDFYNVELKLINLYD